MPTQTHDNSTTVFDDLVSGASSFFTMIGDGFKTKHHTPSQPQRNVDASKFTSLNNTNHSVYLRIPAKAQP